MDSNKNLNTKYYSELAAFQNSQSQFNEDLEQFILDANDDPNDEADNLESSDMERQNDEGNSEETPRPINPFFTGNSLSNDSDSSETPVGNKEINPFYVGDSSSDASHESTSAEDALDDSISKKKPNRIIAYTTKYLLKLFSQRNCKESYFTLFYMLKKKIKDMNIDFNIESIRMLLGQ